MPNPLRRTQPPVLSTVSVGSLRAGVWGIGHRQAASVQLAAAITQRFGAQRVLLTDSGTSALVLALRAAVGREGTVALPGYVCVDVIAAVLGAGLRARLYDIDPCTLSPDPDSVSGALERGAGAVVVAHLFGYPADIVEVGKRAAEHGATVIEDAAQAAGGMLGDRPLGSFGPLTVLSFGRGKGVSGGGGGALLAWGEWAQADAILEAADDLNREVALRGWTALVSSAAQWLLGRPALYGLPSSLPFIGLGETVYREPQRPLPIAGFSAGLAANALRRVDAEAAARERLAMDVLLAAGDTARTGIDSIASGRPGYLRLPVRRRAATPAPHLGILRGYPATLADWDIARHVLHPGETAAVGSVELRETLFTLPTHHHVGEDDVARLGAWLRRDQHG